MAETRSIGLKVLISTAPARASPLRTTVAKAPPSAARRIRAPTQMSVDSSMVSPSLKPSKPCGNLRSVGFVSDCDFPRRLQNGPSGSRIQRRGPTSKRGLYDLLDAPAPGALAQGPDGLDDRRQRHGPDAGRQAGEDPDPPRR